MMSESKIIPYVFLPNEKRYSIPEDLMSRVFLKMKELKLDEVVFVNGQIQNHLQWLMFVQKPGNLVNVIGNATEIEGVTWLSNFGYNYAFGHFCLFPSTWGTKSTEIGDLVLDYWFNHIKRDDWSLDVILGMVPATNQRAIDYTKKIGFLGLGTVPDIKYGQMDAAEGAYFCWLSKGVYNGKRFR